MQISVNDIMEALPPLKGQRDVIVAGEQSVKDIIKEVLESHKQFAGDYDRIVNYFHTADPLRSLFYFCRDTLPYYAEDEKDQTSRSPIAVLMLADNWGVDCKHYSGFIAGTIDALNRAGYTNYDWCYRFASYDPFDSGKDHVFVVVNPGGNEIWIDPAPIEKVDGTFTERTFNDRKVIPFYKEDKKPEDKMSLNRISGCCNPHYQAQSMGLVTGWMPATDDQYDISLNTDYLIPIPDEYKIGADYPTVYYDPGLTFEDPAISTPVNQDPAYDPGTITYSPTDLNKVETTSFPFISDYPTVTGEQPQTLPGTTDTQINTAAPTATPTSNSGLSVGFNVKEFIDANPVESILIGSAIVVGGIWLIARHKKKKKQRQRA